MAWSADGEKLASCSLDNTVRLWAANTGELLRTLEAEKPCNVAWEPSGNRVACGCRSDVRLWDVESGQNVATLKGHTGDIERIQWCPAGTAIAANGTARRGMLLCKAHRAREPALGRSPTMKTQEGDSR